MPKRDDDYMTERRNEILAAAYRRILAVGISGLTVDGICQEAGISMGALYRHFLSKEEILLALVEQSVGHQEARGFQSLDELEKSLMEELDHLDTPQGAANMQLNFQLMQLGTGDRKLNPVFERALLSTEKVLVQNFKRFAASGEISGTVDVKLSARKIATLMRGVWIAKMISPGHPARNYKTCILSEFAVLRD